MILPQYPYTVVCNILVTQDLILPKRSEEQIVLFFMLPAMCAIVFVAFSGIGLLHFYFTVTSLILHLLPNTLVASTWCHSTYRSHFGSRAVFAFTPILTESILHHALPCGAARWHRYL